MTRYSRAVRWAAVGCALSIAPLLASAHEYTQTNLVSDVTGLAASTDPHLKNAWGLSRGASSPWWVTNAGTGTSTLYTGDGTVVTQLVVTIPNAAGVSGPSEPTGTIFNGSTDFVLPVDNAPASFLFSTLEGTIAGWNGTLSPETVASTVVDESKQGAVFTGLTWVTLPGAPPNFVPVHLLLAANFASGQIEEFNATFQRVALPAGAFHDPGVPAGLSPYNVQEVGDTVVVTYAKLGSTAGWVSIFTTTGILTGRLEPGPWLNAPWGVALAPQDFGFFSHNLLIANRGSGTIAAFDVATGQWLGNIQNANNQDIVIDGLWAIEFDNRGNNEFGVGSTTLTSTGPALFFAAGINNYADGLFGALTPIASQLALEDHE